MNCLQVKEKAEEIFTELYDMGDCNIVESDGYWQETINDKEDDIATYYAEEKLEEEHLNEIIIMQLAGTIMRMYEKESSLDGIPGVIDEWYDTKISGMEREDFNYYLCLNILFYGQPFFKAQFVERIFGSSIPALAVEEYEHRNQEELEEAYEFCYEDKKEKWIKKVSSLNEAAQEKELEEDDKKELNNYHIVSRIVLMIKELKGKESWDEILKKIKDYLDSIKIDNIQLSSICYDIVEYFPGGIRVAMSLLGDKLETFTKGEIETIVRKNNGLLGEPLTDSFQYTFAFFPQECLASNYPKKQHEANAVSSDIGNLHDMFIERRNLYIKLAREELVTGRSRLEQSEYFVKLQAVRKKMNEIIEKIILNPIPYIYTYEYYGDDFKKLIGRIVKFYHAVPDDNKRITDKKTLRTICSKCDYGLTKGTKEHVTAISDEIYERKVVEEIDSYLQDDSLEEGLREYLINERNTILQTHPEIENWYLHLSDEFHRNLFEDESLEEHLGFSESDKHYSVIKYYYFVDQRKNAYCGCLESLVSGQENDYQTVYYGIRIKVLRQFLSDGENKYLDRKIKECEAFSAYSSKRAKALLFPRRKRNNKKEEKSEE